MPEVPAVVGLGPVVAGFVGSGVLITLALARALFLEGGCEDFSGVLGLLLHLLENQEKRPWASGPNDERQSFSRKTCLIKGEIKKHLDNSLGRATPMMRGV